MSKMRDGDEYGARMKAYEATETSRTFDPALPVYARIDGRGFSKFTRGMKKPFDATMTSAMIETARHLVAATDARIGYVQSDEISLLWQTESPESGMIFAGRIQKLASVTASMAAAKFASVCPDGYKSRLPAFDCRVFQLPDRSEAANTILWRAMDCRRNAISMVAQAYFSQRELSGRSQTQMLAMLTDAGVDFDAYPAENRLGTFLRRRTETRLLSVEELARLPEGFRPDGPVLRSAVVEIPMPPFNEVANRVEVVFDGAPPLAFDSAEGRDYVRKHYPEDHRRFAAANDAGEGGPHTD